MTGNMGTVDRLARLALALAVATLYFMGKLSGMAAIILGVLAVIFLVTSLVGFCPAYVPFRVSTRKKSSSQ